MKIAISSDNHLDVNQVDVNQALNFQGHWLLDHQVDSYLFAGDLFNDFQQTRAYFTRLQALLGQQTRVYYIAGNHDLLKHAPYALVEECSDPAYLHRRFVDLAGTDWRVIGNNGWYDYSFSSYANQPQRVAQWKRAYWLDSIIDQPLSDQQRMANVLQEVDKQLQAAKLAGKKVILLTHFAPAVEALGQPPANLISPRQRYFYQMFRAMTGSKRLGGLVERSGVVKKVFYGHLHGQHPTFSRHGVDYYHQAVGVRNKRINEWQTDNFFDQWQLTLKTIEL
ncbi:metallophosphoesterase [uncultured Limosilactobacillus sp.]|uniref:metallophosphoesterase n=1 Tax=uncultured Limosilactobacillus sp. TaxID=2837629 RepID=UPI0025D0D020|nr:metallophosphoesterase [uncultured Limosilactobacillus sp.]